MRGSNNPAGRRQSEKQQGSVRGKGRRSRRTTPAAGAFEASRVELVWHGRRFLNSTRNSADESPTGVTRSPRIDLAQH